MPANTNKRVDIENSYYHIYNKGRENKTLFNDAEDFNTFIGYLNEYLTTPTDSPTKKVFTVAGKTFQGVPHMPKNYHKKVELVAYSLIPNTFSLIVKQVERGSLESFIRSLSTRYSIYFNKKYQRTGQLFDGPCKSKYLKNDNEITLLTYYLHKRGGQSSIDKYLYAETPAWLDNRPDIKSYNEFIQKYEPNVEQQEIINSLIFVEPRLISKQSQATNITPQKQTKYISIHQRVPELTFASTFFLILLTFGLVNINTSANSQLATPSSQVAGVNVEIGVEPTSRPQTTQPPVIEKETIGTITIKQTDPLVPISIYNDMDRTSIVLRAMGGAKLDLVNVYNEWNEVKLGANKYGFVESTNVEEQL